MVQSTANLKGWVLGQRKRWSQCPVCSNILVSYKRSPFGAFRSFCPTCGYEE